MPAALRLLQSKSAALAALKANINPHCGNKMVYRLSSSHQRPGQDAEEFCEDAVRSNKTIYNNWITKDENVLKSLQEHFSQETEDFGLLKLSSPPKQKVVKICRLDQSDYAGQKNNTTNRSIYAGGPGSMAAAAMNAVRVAEGKGFETVTYVARDTIDSNYIGSGYNYHEHLACGLNTDRRYRGHTFVTKNLNRWIQSAEQKIEDTKNVAYTNIDIPMTEVLRKDAWANMKLFWDMEVGTLRNMYIKSKGSYKDTAWSYGRKYAKSSKPVLLQMQRWLNQYLPEGSDNVLLPGMMEKDERYSEFRLPDHHDCSMSVALTPEDAVDAGENLKTLAEHNGLPYQPVSREDLEKVFGAGNKVVTAAYYHPEGTRLAPDLHKKYQSLVEATGQEWLGDISINKLFVDEKGVRGIEVIDKNGQASFEACDKLVLSLGYSCKFEYDISNQNMFKRMLGLNKRVTDHITTAVGMSGYILLKGRVPTLEVNINHITPIAYSESADLSLVKITGGGNIASIGFPGTFIIHNIFQIREFFGDRFQGVISFKPCPRSVNVNNFTKFFRLAPGLIVNEGHGGSGMTTHGVNGAVSYLLTHPNVLPGELLQGVPEFLEDVNFKRIFSDKSSITSKVLGLDRPSSAYDVKQHLTF